jgi:DnaJ-class molecular chaperone
MGATEQPNELTDIALCYQAMGVSLDASPAQIEQMYKALTEENKKKSASLEPGAREDAKQSQELVDEMYNKIRGSITYRAMEKDHQKKSAETAEVKLKRPVHQAVVQKRLNMQCPRCNGSITKGLKTCPICKSPIYTTMQKIQRAYFTPTKVIIYCIILSVAAFAVLRLMSPDLFSPSKGEVDILEKDSK